MQEAARPPLSQWWQHKVRRSLNSGDVIAYPTEAVWGLGCDPLDAEAVLRLLRLKQRKMSAGLLLVASNLNQLQPYLGEITPELESQLAATWPGPTNWILPTSQYCPLWVHGVHIGVGVRVSSHPTVSAICDAFGGAIITTSANRRGHAPVKHRWQLGKALNGQVDLVVPGQLGGRKNPCEIRDGFTGKILRSA